MGVKLILANYGKDVMYRALKIMSGLKTEKMTRVGKVTLYNEGLHNLSNFLNITSVKNQ
jgi:hypothetical protein